MYRRLKDQFALRGWQGLPYGIVDGRSGRTALLDAVAFQAASFCDGRTDLSMPLVLPVHREIIDKLEKAGIVAECVADEGLGDWQKYRKSASRFAESVHWSITGRCNLYCRHCYMSAPQAKYGELTTDQCLGIIDQIAAANIGRVSLTGGEPLVREDFWQLVDALRERRIVIAQIYTNGLLVTDALLEQLQARGIDCEFSLSFDGCGCHDWLRGLDGAERAVVDAIRRARAHGFAVGIETALYKDNLPQLRPTYELLKSLDVGHWKMSPAVGVGNWAAEQGRYDIPLAGLYRTYLDVIRWHHADNAPLGLQLGGFYQRGRGSEHGSIPFAKFDGSEKALRQTVCRCARLHLYIMADGKLLPCIPLTGTGIEAEMPSLLDTTISEAMTDSRYFARISTRMETLFASNGECAKCEHRLRCGMGCRAGAIVAGGDFFGRDEACCYFFKNGFEQQIRDIVSLDRPVEDAGGCA